MVHKKLFVKRMTELETDREDLWVQISGGCGGCNIKHFCLGLTYVPPDVDSETFNSYLDVISDKLVQHKIVDVCLFGDFNLANLDWVTSDDDDVYLTPVPHTGRCNSFLDFVNLLNMRQYNSVLNTSGRTLDLILSNMEMSVSVTRHDQPLVEEDQHHPSLSVSLGFVHSKVLGAQVRQYYDFHRVNYDDVNQTLSAVDWETQLHHPHVNDNLSHFYNILMNIIDTHVRKSVRRKQKFPVWFSRELVVLLQLKRQAHKAYKRSDNRDDYRVFSNLRARVKFKLRECHDLYISRLEDDIRAGNIKQFWSHVNRSKKSHGYPPVLCYNNEEANTSQQAAHLFAKYFKSVYITSTDDEPGDETPAAVSCSSTLSHVNVTSHEVKQVLGELDVNKSGGPDGIPSKFIVKCKDSLSGPLALLFNQSLNTGCFPSRWKTASVVPIYKSGDKSNVCNYRPVSLLDVFSKVVELLVYKVIFNHVKHHILVQQHGFYPARSVTSNLLSYTEYIYQSFDQGRQVDSVLTDFSKAFDRVDVALLIIKLKHYGLDGNLLSWVTSYLVDRKQFVILNGCRSEPFVVTSGVPQGSHLGPLFFLLFINDITKHINSQCLLYADDLKIFRQITNVGDCLILQKDLDELMSWCDSNRLHLNLNKCFTITFHRTVNPIVYNYKLGDHTVEHTQTIKDLGVIMDSSLNFSQHISSVVQQSFKLLGFIRRVSQQFNNESVIVGLFTSLVRSRLEYASPVWSPFLHEI
jgi:hypothetical protein